MALTSCPIRLSSRVASKLLASSATRGWNSSDRFSAVDTVDSESEMGSSLSMSDRLVNPARVVIGTLGTSRSPMMVAAASNATKTVDNSVVFLR